MERYVVRRSLADLKPPISPIVIPEGETEAKKQCLDPRELGLHVTHTLRDPEEEDGKPRALIKLAKGSVVDFQGDCIVNAANMYGLGGGGVDGAINARGGLQFEQERRKLPIVVPNTFVRIPTGTAKATKACGKLECKFVVHAVGPDYRKYESQAAADAKLANAYSFAFAQARLHGCSGTMALSLVSSGIFRGECSLEHVLRIAFLCAKRKALPGETVYLVAFSNEEHEVLASMF
ncbi:hypothetical protein BASA81_000906 [Batrachochytrium salamandrivorans]|nr:hypothetical protein BASA81_000906 [Batrachochytrium salamandrivorans]